jgi:hypothetical protein
MLNIPELIPHNVQYCGIGWLLNHFYRMDIRSFLIKMFLVLSETNRHEHITRWHRWMLRAPYAMVYVWTTYDLGFTLLKLFLSSNWKTVKDTTHRFGDKSLWLLGVHQLKFTNSVQMSERTVQKFFSSELNFSNSSSERTERWLWNTCNLAS